MTWTTYKIPNLHYWAVRDADTGTYLEGDYPDAVYAAGVPAWSSLRAAQRHADELNVGL